MALIEARQHLTQVTRTPLVLLDTRDVVNLDKVRNGACLPNDSDGNTGREYSRLASWMRQGVCIPLFDETLAFEWIQSAGRERAMNLATVFDQAMVVKRIEPAPVIWVLEALRECKRIRPDWNIPDFAIVADFDLVSPSRALLEQHLPGAVGTRQGYIMPRKPIKPTVRLFVELCARDLEPKKDLWREGQAGDKEAFEMTKAGHQSQPHRRAFDERTKRLWLRDNCNAGAALRSITGHPDSIAVFDEIEVANCPSVQLYVDVYNKYVRAKAMYDDPHDFVDQSLVSAVPYADFALLDNRWREYVRQGLGRSNPLAKRIVSDIRELNELISNSLTVEV